MAHAYWLIKSEPTKYPWSRLLSDGSTSWDGVRNFEARNNLRAMKQGDLLLYYHSVEGKQIVGVARVLRTAYQDPTTPDDWSAVDVGPAYPLAEAVDLSAIKAEPTLANMALVRRPRISVVRVSAAEFRKVLKMGKTSSPRPKYS